MKVLDVTNKDKLIRKDHLCSSGNKYMAMGLPYLPENHPGCRVSGNKACGLAAPGKGPRPCEVQVIHRALLFHALEQALWFLPYGDLPQT